MIEQRRPSGILHVLRRVWGHERELNWTFMREMFLFFFVFVTQTSCSFVSVFIYRQYQAAQWLAASPGLSSRCLLRWYRSHWGWHDFVEHFRWTTQQHNQRHSWKIVETNPRSVTTFDWVFWLAAAVGTRVLPRNPRQVLVRICHVPLIRVRFLTRERLFFLHNLLTNK